MNILVIGKPNDDISALVKNSKYTDKVYTALNHGNTEFPNIEYRNFNELIEKALALKIDIAINVDKTLIKKGIAEDFAAGKVNLISVNKKWLNLETSRLCAKELLNHYKIKTPKIIRTPLKFPIVIKTDTPNFEYTANTMNEVVSCMKKLEGRKTFFEEFVTGSTIDVYSMWDKKNIKYFYNTKSLTEVQIDRLDLIKTKLCFMFSDEQADFIGIFDIKLTWYKNDWCITGFDMGATIPPNILDGKDFLYLLNAALYQKLGEL